MRILVLGGTQFLGRHVVDAGALARPRRDAVQPRPDAARALSRRREAPRRPRRRPRRARRAGASTRSSTRAATSRASSPRRSTRSATSATTRSSRPSRSTPISPSRPPRRARSQQLAEPSEEWQEHYGALKALCEDAVRAPLPRRLRAPAGPDRRPVGSRPAASPTGRCASPRAAPCSPPPPPSTPSQVDRRPRPRRLDRHGRRAQARPARTTPSARPRRSARSCRPASTSPSSDAELVWVDPEFLARARGRAVDGASALAARPRVRRHDEHLRRPWRSLPD